MLEHNTIHVILHNEYQDPYFCPIPYINFKDQQKEGRKIIKKQLKKVVDTSNTLQDAVNDLKDIKKKLQHSI